MTKEQITLSLKVVSDISDVRHNVEQLSSLIRNLGSNIKPDLGMKFSGKINDFFSEYERFIKLQDTPNKSISQIKTMEQVGARLVTIYKDLSISFSKIDTKDWKIDLDPETVKQYSAEISKFSKEISNTFNKTAAYRGNNPISQAVKDIEISGGRALKPIQDLQAAFQSGNYLEVASAMDVVIAKFNIFSKKDKEAIQPIIDAWTALQNRLSGNTNFQNSLNGLVQSTENLNRETETANEIFTRQKTEFNGNSEKLKKLTEQLVQAAKAENLASQNADQLKNRLLALVSVNSGIQLLRRTFQQTTQAIKDLDSVMTEMAVVTDATVTDYWNQLPQYTERAYELGAAISDVYESMTLYYQQGLNTSEATALSTSTLKMARIASLDAEEATQRMTNALRGFNMVLNETSVENVADVYSALAAKSAANVDQISTAMTKVASIAHSANMEFETTAALLTQIIETTQESAETAGTALKTVIARFSEVKTLIEEGQTSGTDSEGDAIDVNNISKALRTVGIDLNEYINGSIGLDEIFLQLASQWDTLNEKTKKYIATMAAGSRQQSRFIAMMQDYTRTTELVSIANNAAGASSEQFNKTLDSLEAKLNQLKTQWQSFTTTILNQGVIKFGVDIATKFLDVINKITGNSTIGKIIVFALMWKTASSAINGIVKGITVLSAKAELLTGINKAGIVLSIAEKKELEDRIKQYSIINSLKVKGNAIKTKGLSILIIEALEKKGILKTETAINAINEMENKNAWQRLLILGKTKAVIAGIEVSIGTILGWTVAIAAAITGINHIYNNFINLNKIAENIEEADENLKTTKNELTSINSELEQARNTLKELENSKGITLISDEQILATKNTIRELDAAQQRAQKTLDDAEAKADEQRNRYNNAFRLKGIQFVNAYTASGQNGISSDDAWKAWYNDATNAADYFDNVISGASDNWLKNNKDAVNAWAVGAWRSGVFDFQTMASYVVDDFDAATFIEEIKNDTKSDKTQFIIDTFDISEEELSRLIAKIEEELKIEAEVSLTVDTKSLITQLNTLKDAMSSLEDVFEDIELGKAVDIDTIADIEEAFGSLTDEERSMLMNAEQVSNGINQIVSRYIREKNILSEVNAETYEYTVAQLEALGITNAYDVVMDSWIRSTISQEQELNDVQKAWIEQQKIIGNNIELLKKYELQVNIIQKGGLKQYLLNDADGFLSYATAVGASAESLAIFTEGITLLKAAQAGVSASGFYRSVEKFTGIDEKDINPNNVIDYITQAMQKELDSVLAQVNITKTNINKSSSNSNNKWENSYDRYYNKLENIAELTNRLTDLQDEYNNLIKEGNSNKVLENQQKQLQNLKDQAKAYEELKALREKEIQSLLKSNSKYGKYAGYKNGQIWINWELVNTIKNETEGEAIEKYISELERIDDSIDETNSELIKLRTQEKELLEQNNKAYLTLENKIKEALIESYQNEIDEFKSLGDKLDDINSSIVENINDIIKDQRDAREQQKTETELENKRIRLEYLRQDTSGSNALAIKQLEEEIANSEQSYTDKLIDDKINELEEQNDIASKQREKQIELMQDQLESYQKTQSFWDEINEIINSSIDSDGVFRKENSALVNLLKSTENFGSLSQIGGQSWLDELSEVVIAGIAGKKYSEVQSKNQTVNLINQTDNQNTTLDSNEVSITKDVIKNIAAAVWQGYWGNGNNRTALLIQTFGEQATKDIQIEVNKGYAQNSGGNSSWGPNGINVINKKWKKYATGGLADYSGLAWLDGTPQKPELILNSQDTENFIQLKDVLRNSFGQFKDKTYLGDAYYSFNIQVDQLSNDYDVDQLVSKIQSKIENSSKYRNVNAINLIR